MFCYDGLPFWIRGMLLGLAFLLSLYLAKAHRTAFVHIKVLVRWLSQRPIYAGLSLLAISLCCNLLLTWLAYPRPMVHDEFAYLLAADTYASGRLSNPSHAMWEHFETYHILFQPTYMAKYPPATALILAFGLITTGHAIVGSWLATGFGIVCLYWMLRAWIGDRWALIGGLLLACNVPLLMAWGQTYWGGGMALMGGSLLFGSLRRITDHKRACGAIWQNSVILGIGAIVLALSRPFEGLFVCGLAAIILMHWLATSRRLSLSRKATELGLPLLILGTVGCAGLLYNNHVVTGDAWQLPYSAHGKQYSATSLCIWQPLPVEKEYRLPRMATFYKHWSRARQETAKTLTGYFNLVAKKLNLLWRYYPFLGGICLVPIVFLLRQNRWLQFCVVAVAILLLIELQLVHNYTYPHYVAPVACLFYVLLLHGMRYWQRQGKQYPVLATIPTTIYLYSLLCLVALIATRWKDTDPGARFAIESKLQQQAGFHLVFVDYPADHNLHQEWVYNRADIDTAKIVWANDLSAAQNKQLIDYYPKRTIWHWPVGKSLQPYSARHKTTPQ